ncbi:MAG TPA: hypothetical protein VNV60_07130, partial [Holophagaceae bacterium]|nr:hypothetical protein [Holophagaceae bacterium]
AALDGEATLRSLAEAATQNDPAFNQSHHLLAAAAAADLAPGLSNEARSVMCAAIAKSLANSQGSSDLGRRADKAFAQLP